MTAKFQIFGDESIHSNHVVYALVIVPTEKIEKIERLLVEVKEKHGADGSSRFHCRQLFAKDQRLKSPWAHLDNKQAYDFAYQVCMSLANQSLGTIVGHVNKNTAPLEMEGGGSAQSVRITDAKQLIPYAYQAAVGQLMFDPIYKDQCEFWTEPNNDKIQWWAGRRQVGQLLSSNRIDLAQGSMEKILEAENLHSKEWRSLLEMADMLAYCTSYVLANAAVFPKRYSDHVITAIHNTMAPTINTLQFASPSLPEGNFTNLSVLKRAGKQ